MIKVESNISSTSEDGKIYYRNTVEYSKQDT